jgi:ATP-dependent Lon protease
LNEYIRTNNLVGSVVGLTVSSSNQSNSFGDAIKISLMIKKTNKIDDKKIFKNPKNTSYKISTSGKIKDIFKQSLEIALNVATQHLCTIDYKKYKNFFINNEIHFHLPDMLVEKDGPSAGIALYLCAMSIALNKPLRNNLALTGEISYDGSVLKIGGVRQKCQGALRYNIKHIILPIGNKEDFEKLPNDMKNLFENVYFVSNYLQVYNIAFEMDEMNDCKYYKIEDNIEIANNPFMKL